ncbi:MAG: class I SAM-dependent methyltransferase [Candidatus Omnitrophica bacterium]|nr:class I SAM-dependent methyltransferase [Candidatus Omnitrophota bacterium]
MVFANVVESDIVQAYEKDYYQTIYHDYESDRNIHDKNNIQFLQDIEKHFSPGTMIEIGSAFGFFLDTAKKRKWETTGYEMSEYASMIARDKYHQNIKTTDFLKDVIPNKVDLIAMFDTIEHLLKPSHYIEKFSQTLKPGGGLIITTGDISSFVARLSGIKWRMIYPPLHIYYYSPKTITRLLEKYGFEILSITRESKYQNLNSILQHLFGIPKKVIPAIPISVNIGDIMQVIARKR